MGPAVRRKKLSLHLRSLRNSAPSQPATRPSRMNQGSWPRRETSKSGTMYQGLMPKKVRDATEAITEEKTRGA